MKKIERHRGAGKKTQTKPPKTRAELADRSAEVARARAELAETHVEQARARTELAETRAEQAKTRAELAETRTEQAETRTEMAKTRTEQAEIRAEQAETILERVIHKKVFLGHAIPPRLLKTVTVDAIADTKSPLEPLTDRQREVLELIAKGQNTKQIAETLKISPKTVEYHRMKLMNGLNLHDIPALVRFALREGLIPPES
jgi:DNA-binding NarL/FixJ family response regulator